MPTSLATSVALVCVVGAVGCGGDGGGPAPPAPDAGASGCAPGEVPAPEGCRPAGVPPESCAPGFAPTEDRACAAILPPDACGGGQISVPGDATCREVAPCGEGRWGSIPIEPGTQFVDGQYSGGGSDGTEAHPWTTIQDGIDAADAGAIVAVAAGSYPEQPTIEGSPARLWGRCPGMVEILAAGPSQSVALLVGKGAGDSEIHDLAITGSTFGIVVSGSEGIAIDRVWIHDTAHQGLVADDTYGATQVSISGSLIERAHDSGILVAGADTSVDTTAIRDTAAGMQSQGLGISVFASESGKRSTAAIAGSIFERNASVGVDIQASDATISATVIRDTRARADKSHGEGVSIHPSDVATERAVVHISASVVEGNVGVGVLVVASDAELDAVVVRGTAPDAHDATDGRGISAQSWAGERAAVTLRSCVVEQNHEVGALVYGSDGTFESTIVRDTLPQESDGTFGVGIAVQHDLTSAAPGNLTIRWSVLERLLTAGVTVSEATATIEGSVVRDVGPQVAGGAYGDGIVVEQNTQGASVTLAGSRIEASARAGLSVFSATADVRSTTFECNAFDLDGEAAPGPFVLIDEGGNVCGCEGAHVECKVVSSNLAAPTPIGSGTP